jgi:hypothetical protein
MNKFWVNVTMKNQLTVKDFENSKEAIEFATSKINPYADKLPLAYALLDFSEAYIAEGENYAILGKYDG